MWTSSSRVHITFTGLPASFDSSTASMMKSTSRWPRRPKPPPISMSCSLTLSRDAEHLGRRLGRHGLALRAGPDLDRIARRRHRGDRVQRLHLRVIGVVAAILGLHGGGGLRHSRARIADLAPLGRLWRGFSASAANRSTPLSLSKPQALPVLAPGHGLRAAPGALRTPPTASRRARRRHRASARHVTTPGDRLGLGIVDLVGRPSLRPARAAPLP